MSTIATLCQAGELEAAYRQAKSALDQHPDSVYAQADMHLAVLACLKKYVAQADAAVTVRWVRKLAALNLPPQAGRDEQLCWEIRKLLATLAKRQYPPHAEVAELLRALTTLNLAPVPSRGRSLLLQTALKFKEQLPAEWWAWWSFELLRPEDYVKELFTPSGTDKAIRLPALAETAYGAYARSLIKRLTPNFVMKGELGQILHNQLHASTRLETQALLPRLEELSTNHTDYGWLGYYRAKLLVALGDTAAALPTLRPLVRQKSGEYWAWQLLAETLRPTDPTAALACYYRATQCHSDEMYLGRLRETLATLLHEAGHLAEAQQQLRLLTQAKEAEGKAPPYAAQQLISQPWFAQVYPIDKRVHFDLLAQADTAAYGDLPWQPVVLQEMIAATTEKPARARLLPAGRSARPLTVKLKKYPWLSKYPPGTPLQVRCEPVNGFPQAVQVAPRPDGQPWDVRPASRPEPVNVATREFDGPLRVQAAGFGFVNGIFVPAHLITKNSWQAGQKLKGIAISQFDNKKGKDGWVAQQATIIS
jgi:hypothetical protein